MNTDLIKFKRRLNDPVMNNYISDLVEEEIDDSVPCNYDLEGWFKNILDGSTNRVIREYTYDELFSEGAYLNEELFRYIYQYLLSKYRSRIKFTYEDRIDGCDGDDEDYYGSLLYGVDNN